MSTARMWWVVFAGAWLVLALVGMLQVALSMSELGSPVHWWSLGNVRVVEALVILGVAAPVLWLVRRALPPERTGVATHLAAVVAALAPTALLATHAALAANALVFGEGFLFRGSRWGKAVTELVLLALAAAIATAWELGRRLRERETQAARLEARLADARLQALGSQLHPHFLFNTLTAISVLVHRAPDDADTMLTRLADLLRATLRQPPAHEIPLGEELALLARYVDIMRVRYGPRLVVETRVPPAAADLLVPTFALQPLVENAIEHGVARRAGQGTVTVSAAVEDGRLRLEVEDDGPGVAVGSNGDDGGNGIGLANTRQRLRQLYGDRQRLDLAAAPGGGTRAVMELPAHREPAHREPAHTAEAR